MGTVSIVSIQDLHKVSLVLATTLPKDLPALTSFGGTVGGASSGPQIHGQ